MIDLSKLAFTFGIQVDYSTTTKHILSFNQMAGHLANIAFDNALDECFLCIIVFQSCYGGRREQLND
jgi:hypothetical protein